MLRCDLRVRIPLPSSLRLTWINLATRLPQNNNNATCILKNHQNMLRQVKMVSIVRIIPLKRNKKKKNNLNNVPWTKISYTLFSLKKTAISKLLFFERLMWTFNPK